MKSLNAAMILIVVLGHFSQSPAQSVSVNIVLPTSGASIRTDQVYIAATATSTFEIHGLQASVEGRTVDLVYSSSTYSNCIAGFCTPQPGWSNIISLAGLSRGSKTLTVTATDVFGNSNQAQRNFVYDLPPALTVTAPVDGMVARPGVQVVASATDDNPAGTQIEVYQAVDYSGGPLLASGMNTLNTNLDLSTSDGGVVSLMIRARDSANQTTTVFRQVYVQSSSNLVEVTNVGDGWIRDAQPDRLLFLSIENGSLPPGYYGSGTQFHLKTKSRTNGEVKSAFAQSDMQIAGGFLAPQGAVFVASASPYVGYTTGYGLFQSFADSEILHATHGHGAIGLLVRGSFATWGWGDGGGFTPSLYLTDLLATNTSMITSAYGFSGVQNDLAANGDVVFSPIDGYGGHAIYRFRNGAATLLVSNAGNQSTNRFESPKTDGTNAFYIHVTPSEQSLKMITNGGEVLLAQGVAIGGSYLLNNGWVAFARSGGGQMQIWRRSPGGINTQLTFYGTSSTLAALAPNGEVALYNGSKLYLSKGTWPPQEIATATSGSGLSMFWEEGRWCATLGRSLFQIYPGTPQLIARSSDPNTFGLNLIGARGQRLVTECSTNHVHWTSIATNDIIDGGNFEVWSALDRNVPGKYYRLRAQ